MQPKKLPKLLPLAVLAVLTTTFISKSFPKLKLWFKKKLPNAMDDNLVEAKNITRRYSRKSDKLWEEGPQCSNTKVKFNFAYKSRYQNAYGEPVFYIKKEEPNRIFPVTSGRMPGFYNAYPGGLNIDPQTGEIDINDSNAGARYTVEFTPCGANCVVRTQVVISGIGFEGGVFSLSSPGDLNIRPFYFGSTSPEEEFPSQEVPSRRTPSGEFGLNPEPNQKPTADLVGLALDRKSASIDLRETIKSGALGFRRNPDGTCDEFPVNGASKDFTIYYRLAKGPGQDVLHKTKVRVHFFDTEADMPEDLKVRIRQQNNSIFRRSLPLAMLPAMSWAFVSDSPWDLLPGLFATISSFLFLMSKARESNDPLTPPEVCVSR